MSIRFRDKNGIERVVSGLTPGGDIEYGAVATRSGIVGSPTITIPANSIYGAQVTFDTAMPDADYEITLTAVTIPTNLGGKLNFEVYAKTANGFTIGMYNGNDVDCAGISMKWKAFKLYTVADAEALYSTVQDIEAMVPDSASSTNKFATANDLRTETRSLDRRLDDVEDVIPSSASITNKLVTQSDLSGVEIDKVEDINDVELTNIQDGQTLVWDDENSQWVNGAGGKIYSAGDGINISNTDEISAKVDDTSITTDTNDALKVADTYKTIFVGTRAQWEALSAADKAKYSLVSLTDDSNGIDVTDTVTDGDMRPVTSNAVFDEFATKGDFLHIGDTTVLKTITTDVKLSDYSYIYAVQVYSGNYYTNAVTVPMKLFLKDQTSQYQAYSSTPGPSGIEQYGTFRYGGDDNKVVVTRMTGNFTFRFYLIR